VSGEERSVLIVDDDPDTRSQLAWSLRDEHHVLLAGDPGEARIRLRENPVDLVLLDLHLPPDTDDIRQGLDLLEWIRAEAKDLPVIVITGDRGTDTERICLRRGAFGFFRKSAPTEELRAMLARALEMRRLGATPESRD
jgi:DNA-binding NtrC family response regulator